MDNPIHTRFTLPCLGLRAAAAVLLLLLLLSPAAITPVASHNDHGEHKNYLVIVRSRYEYDKNVHKNVSSWHASLLSSVCDTAKEVLEADPTAISRLIYSYRTVVNGFAARMTPEELDKMSKMEWFDRALPEQTFHLLTTRTPHMLGLMGGRRHGGLWNTSNMGEGVIIGILDDGIYAGHPSFDGAGMQPPPAKWKGRCDFNKTVCNNKLIGARSYFESAKWKWKGLRDPVLPIAEGQHGTHTSSTAAGAFVPNASVFGNGLGTAAGMAPRAHIAFYQVCYEDKGCDRDDILAAVDDAIGDGVDILSLSLGHEDAIDFSDDPVSLAGYTAILNGVFICAAAGNTGPSPSTLVNEAPWLLTVGASTTDRRFLASVKLGDNVQIDGESLNDPNTTMGDLVPLVRDVSDGLCVNGNVLKAQNVSGKIIICEAGGDVSTAKAKMLKGIGVVGMIVVTPELFGPVIIPRPHAIPTVQVSNAAGQKIKAYIHKARGPTATFVFKGAAFNTPRSPMVAPFSSRGPNRRSRGILKPDIIGPGVNIIAGVPSIEDVDLLRNAEVPRFDIKSGTSMAAPHLSGIAALIKHAHPTWSPAVIKSALMTTAEPNDNLRKPIQDVNGRPANLVAIGAGHVNPKKAMDPGLVYNMTAMGYVPYLCGLNYTDDKVSTIIYPEPPVSCAKLSRLEQDDLNYPSITVILNQPPFTAKANRSVTNVGAASSTYTVEVNVPASVTVEVNPPKLTFKALEEVLNYSVTIKSANGQALTGPVEGELKWLSGKYVVRSPILVTNESGPSPAETRKP
ncbi:subtilisin-like protease 1 [Zea mays]|uniref:Putative subtilase family protein n=1 Tax=Zea mays TaxID=4577 RepID=K7TRW1_MAIZE|nr:subtilisin-like protease 1 [Zea mays]AQK45713.1 Putative subtilase family protein [Zea mays]|eukprot:XP_008663514.1 subtilisin-like protease SBT1.8 [Zea mays]